MQTFTNPDGRAEWVFIDDDGRLRNKWEQPSKPALSEWGVPLGDFALTDLGEFVNVNGQQWAPAVGAPVYGYPHCTVIVKDGRWEVQQTDMLREFLAGAGGR